MDHKIQEKYGVETEDSEQSSFIQSNTNCKTLKTRKVHLNQTKK